MFARLLFAAMLFSSLHACSRAAEVTLDAQGTLAFKGDASPYNIFYVYYHNYHDDSAGVDVVGYDATSFVQTTYPGGAIKAVVADMHATGAYSVNVFYNATAIDSTAFALAAYDNAMMHPGAGHATFFTGPAIQNFYYVRRSDTIHSGGNDWTVYVD